MIGIEVLSVAAVLDSPSIIVLLISTGMGLGSEQPPRRRCHSGPYPLVISFVDMGADDSPLVFIGKAHSSVSYLADDIVGTS